MNAHVQPRRSWDDMKKPRARRAYDRDNSLDEAQSLLFGADVPEALLWIERALGPNFSGLADRVRRYYEARGAQ